MATNILSGKIQNSNPMHSPRACITLVSDGFFVMKRRKSSLTERTCVLHVCGKMERIAPPIRRLRSYFPRQLALNMCWYAAGLSFHFTTLKLSRRKQRM